MKSEQKPAEHPKWGVQEMWMQFHFSSVIISHLFLTCSVLREVPFNGAAWLMGHSYSSIKPGEQTSASHCTNTLLIPRMHGTVLLHGKQSHGLPHCKAMLISRAIKTVRLINKEKAYKRKECQTEEEVVVGGGGLKLRLTIERNVGDQTPAEGVLNILGSFFWVIWGIICVCVCVMFFVQSKGHSDWEYLWALFFLITTSVCRWI